MIFNGNGANNTNQVIYSPSSWAQGSSMSHFNCTAAGCSIAGNGYAMNFCSGFGLNSIQRAPHIAEVETLCDLGYNVQGTYGNGEFTAPTTYPVNCGLDLQVAGTNDFRDYTFLNGLPDFTVVAGNTISFTGFGTNGILENDFNATTFDCVEVVIGGDDTNLNVVGQIIDYTPPIGFAGTAVLKYRPVNGMGNRGNMTYIFIVVEDAPLPPCPANDCNLVCHGDFSIFDGGVGPLAGFMLEGASENSPNLFADGAGNQFVAISDWGFINESIWFEINKH